MSDSYLHSGHKFADAGLQLRVPVDLVSETQYSRLTNALPVIEGELRARSGLTLVSSVAPIASVTMLSCSLAGQAYLNQAATVGPHGYHDGDSTTLTILSIANGSIPPNNYPKTYAITLTSVSPTSFIFTPTIPASGTGTFNQINVVAKATAVTLVSLADTTIHTIFRLNQALASVTGDRLVGLASKLYRAALPEGNDFYELVTVDANGVVTGVPNLSGDPLSMIAYRFTLDTASWAIIADRNVMYKYRPAEGGGTGAFFYALGNAPPTVGATATAGGAGNLNSSGGTDYDWRYTYVDSQVKTESNPSPIAISSGTVTVRPTTFTNPAITGEVPFTNPANAYDGSSATFASGGAVTVGLDQVKSSCQWQGFPDQPDNVSAVALSVDAQIVIDAPSNWGTVTLDYSLNNGVSWNTLVTTKTTQARTIYKADLPASVPFPQLIVRARAQIKGTFDGASAGISVYEISTKVTGGAISATLALTNQSADVCVTAPTLPQHGYIRLYRRGGSLADTWRRVGEFAVASLVQGICGAGSLLINDNASDTTLEGSDIIELDNDQPVSSVQVTNQPLNFIWGPFGLEARVLGCGDPARPECVYYSKSGNPDSWPPQNFVEVSNPGTPIIAGCIYGTRSFAFSRERQFELIEGLLAGSTFFPFLTPCSRGIISRFGLCVGPLIYFVAKDGVYSTEGGRETSLVENDIKPLFPTLDGPGREVNSYEAVDMDQPDTIRLAFHNDELYFNYLGLTTGTRQQLIYDTRKNRWRAGLQTSRATVVYSEPNTTSSLLVGTAAGSLYQTGGTHDPAELDTIENFISSSVVAAGVTLVPGAYYTRLLRYTSEGAVAISLEQGPLTVDGTHGIASIIPRGAADTVKWRIYYGTAAGQENQFTESNEVALPANRTVTIIAPGTAGTMPVVNATGDIAVVLRTGAYDQNQALNLKEYGSIIFDLDPGGADVTHPVTITPIINGEVTTESAITVTGSGRQQVPLPLGDIYAFNLEFEIAWHRSTVGAIVSDPVLYQLDILHRFEPAMLTHWETRESADGMPGYQHKRDIYVALRSTAVVTMQMIFDGITQSYTLPSTGGARQKLYLRLNSNKGKLYRWIFDSAAPFRLYEQDCEVRTKPWLGVLGYQVQRPFGGEMQAASMLYRDQAGGAK